MRALQLGDCHGPLQKTVSACHVHLMMQCSLLPIHCRWGAIPSISGSANHMARNTRRLKAMVHAYHTTNTIPIPTRLGSCSGLYNEWTGNRPCFHEAVIWWRPKSLAHTLFLRLQRDTICLVPIWRQDICSQHDHERQSAHIRCAKITTIFGLSAIISDHP